ncbi:hypothetical protein OSSY52_20120 [Tepiditoga spiralis]|uniref:Cell shape-determining protein MreC n=1 Tax=Tepiditoga spiralis TaxID=2108365 RepID=A0A7G1G614_9BACT|nr:hypothetical protein [Tepiditoga spiralis]BBE31871.1 hypothetical protein OSSY52_20120 [Tepiditoga spiralis]
MFKNKIFYLNIFIVLTIMINIYKPIGNIVQWVSYPFNYVFSKLQEEILIRDSRAESLKNILSIISSNKIQLKKGENLKFSIPYGIILKEEYKYLIVHSNEKVSKNSFVIDDEGNLIGFSEKTYSNRIIVKKLGWGTNEIFGEIGGYDVLIKEDNGNLFVELPQKINEKILTITLPYYIDTINKKKVILTGKIISKYGEMYLFKPLKFKGILAYFLEE